MSVQAADASWPAGALRPMREDDLDAVIAVELRAYEFPWSLGILRDCLRADHPSWVLHLDGRIIGYFLISLGAGEAHVLNVCVDPDYQGRGYGRKLLQAAQHVARGRSAQRLFLEVRPSNRGAIALYFDEGFNEIGRRPRYYPGRDGREDALVMAMELLPPE